MTQTFDLAQLEPDRKQTAQIFHGCVSFFPWNIIITSGTNGNNISRPVGPVFSSGQHLPTSFSKEPIRRLNFYELIPIQKAEMYR